MSQDDLQQLQLLEQSLQQLLVQKQSVQSQLVEVESALEELGSTTESWKVVGNLMVRKDAKVLEQELSERKKALSLRVSSIEKQEERLRSKAKDLQQSVLGSMGDE